MAGIKIRHNAVRKGKYGYWLPTPQMKRMGFQNVPCGIDGPDAWKIAREWEDRDQRARRGLEEAPSGQVYPPGSVGDGFTRFRRSQEWAKKPPRTREDWERSWVYINPVFGTAATATVSFELLDRWYHHLIASRALERLAALSRFGARSTPSWSASKWRRPAILPRLSAKLA